MTVWPLSEELFDPAGDGASVLLDGFVPKPHKPGTNRHVEVHAQRYQALIDRGYCFLDLTKRQYNALRKSGVRCGWIGKQSAWVPRWAQRVLHQPRGQYIKTLKLLRDDPLARQLLESHPDTLEVLMAKSP